MLDFDQSSIGAFLKTNLPASSPQMVSFEYGTVDSCADGIVHVSGLSRAKYGLSFWNLPVTCTALPWI